MYHYIEEVTDMEPTKTKTQKFHYGFIILIGCCFITGVAVAIPINCSGLFTAHVCKELNIGQGAFNLAITIMFLTMALLLPFGGKIIAKFDIRVISTLAAIAVGGAFFLNSFYTSVFPFYISGFLMGLGGVFNLFLTGPTLMNRWFKLRNGFYLGIAMAFTGIGAIVFGSVGGALIDAFGWRSTYRILAIITLITCVPVSLFLFRSFPKDKGLEPYGAEKAAELNAQQSAEKGKETGVSAKVAFRSLPFYLVCLFTLCGSFGTSGINQYIPPFVVLGGYSATLSGVVLSCTSLGNTGGKIILGYINDKSNQIAVIIGTLCGISGLGLLLLFAHMGTWVIFTGATLFGVALAFPVVQTPLFVNKLFGRREYPQIYSWIMPLSSFGSAFSFTLYGVIKDVTGSYDNVFKLALCLLCVACIAGTCALITGKKLKHTTE